jgi:uncharacterized protein with HEPN domain
MRERDKATLLDIDKPGRLSRSFIQDTRKREFLVDPKAQSSVLYQLLVIGEGD